MSLTYENAADQITIQDAIELYEIGIATVITDGRDVTFETETVSTSSKKKADQSQQL